MSRFLQILLENEEALFPSALKKLEQHAGGTGIDTRLIADVIEKTHTILKAMGLSLTDSAAREVYHALNSYVMHDQSMDILLDADFVLYEFKGEVVSFNLIDIIENAHHELPFEKRITSHGRRALRGEIIGRYLGNPLTIDQTVRELASDAKLLDEEDSPKTRPIAEYKSNLESKLPYVLAIGDIFTDAFIKLNQDEARIETDENGEKRISLPLGSKPPYDGVDIVKAVGPGPNAAVAIARLGLRAGLDSFIGDDQVGQEAIVYLQHEGVDTSTMHIEKGINTSYYFVLRYGAERTILVKNEQFNYTWSPPTREPDWIYLALISDDSWQFHESLLLYLNEHPDTKLAFQPGTFHFKWGVKKLAGIYRRTHIIVLNREEAVEVTAQPHDSIKKLADGLHSLGPKIVVITDGPNGSYASFDGRIVTIPNYPDAGPPVDRTGAGDAFASTIVAALALGETMDTALTWAPINSASVVQKIGAQAGLLGKKQIEEFLSKAPEGYKVTEYED